MTVFQWQFVSLSVAALICLALLLKNRVVMAKLVVALGITAVAALQLLNTPLDRTIAGIEQDRAILSEQNPKYAKLTKNLDAAKERLAAARKGEGKWTDLLPFRLGLDLQGGTEVRLRLKPDKTILQRLHRELKLVEAMQPGAARDKKLAEKQKELKDEEEALTRNFDNAVDVIRERLNASGLAEIPVTRQGKDRVLVQLPGMGEAETDRIIGIIQQQGKLEFRMVTPETSEQKNHIKGETKFYRKVREQEWADNDTRNISPDDYSVVPEDQIDEQGRDKRFRSDLYDWLRTPDVIKESGAEDKGQFFLVEQVAQIGGERITKAKADQDLQRGGWRVTIGFDQVGAELFRRITTANVGRQLGIVLDGKLRSAPNINTAIGGGSAEITGSFDRAEAEQLAIVLKSGSLKVKIEKEMTNSAGATLGADSIRSGISAMTIGLLAVIAFMLVYYLVAGVVTNIALFLNMLLIVACLSSFDATLTLPGIAGLILTIGMAVDANVLIFERIREERDKGNSLTRSIELGYERAFVTIIDANVTTLITALILHEFGTEQVKGFAITLIFGIIMSVFCALVVTRWIFNALTEMKAISELKMLKIFDKPSINFISMRRPAFVLSIVLIAAGMVVFGMRGDRNYSYQFTGGTLAQVDPGISMTTKAARERVKNTMQKSFPDVVQSVQSFGEPEADGTYRQFVLKTQYVRPQLTDEESVAVSEIKYKTAAEFKDAIRVAFPELPRDGLLIGEEPLEAYGTKTETYFRVDLSLAKPMSAKELQSVLVKETELIGPRVIRTEQAFPEAPTAASASIVADFDLKGEGGKDQTPKACLAAFKATLKASTQDLVDVEKGAANPEVVVANDLQMGKQRVKMLLALKRPASKKEVLAALQAGEESAYQNLRATLIDPVGMPEADETKTLALSVLCAVPRKSETGLVRSTMVLQRAIQDKFQTVVDKGTLSLSEPFPRFASVGGVVAGEMQMTALQALLAAMVAIFFYIWLRFQFRASFGFGAVAALVHDVLFVLGALAVADEFGLLNGQIDLNIVAALLTIVGYSLNDTIVVFDRVRENLHGGQSLEDVINISINQTISRTIITSVTTLLVVLCLLVLGGDVIRGFAFALFIGVLVGTYSSIFIASPLLVEMVAAKEWNDKRKREAVAAGA